MIFGDGIRDRRDHDIVLKTQKRKTRHYTNIIVGILHDYKKLIDSHSIITPLFSFVSFSTKQEM